MLEVSQATKRAIKAHAYRDLAPSPTVVNGKIALALLTGGLVSLALCSQFGVGLTATAQQGAAVVARIDNDFLRAVTAGVVFPVPPILMLRALCSGLQFRRLAQRRPLSLMIWLAACGLLIGQVASEGFFGATAVGDAPHQTLTGFATWLAAATLSFYGIAGLVDKLTFSIKRYLDTELQATS